MFWGTTLTNLIQLFINQQQDIIETDFCFKRHEAMQFHEKEGELKNNKNNFQSKTCQQIYDEPAIEKQVDRRIELIHFQKVDLDESNESSDVQHEVSHILPIITDHLKSANFHLDDYCLCQRNMPDLVISTHGKCLNKLEDRKILRSRFIGQSLRSISLHFSSLSKRKDVSFFCHFD